MATQQQSSLHKSEFGVQDNQKSQKREFNQLIHAAKDQETHANFEAALTLYQKALHVVPEHAKLISKIEKLKLKVAFIKTLTHLDNVWQQDPKSTDVILDAGVNMQYSMTYSIFEKLYPHQREGVSWMWGLFKRSSGGILGDDMGLGKTIQVASFIHGLFHSKHIDKALLIMPLSLMPNWQSELAKWCPRKRVRLFHGTSTNRERALEEILEKSGIILTTYETAQSAFKTLSMNGEEAIQWDVIILDEGHKIKDPSKKTSKAISTFQARSKFILSGTPILNNLKELWALLNYTCDGQLLGDMKVFKREFEEPITRGQMKDATEYEKQKGFAVTNKLRSLIEPHFIRRLKSDIASKTEIKLSNATDENSPNQKSASPTRSDAAPGIDSSTSTPTRNTQLSRVNHRDNDDEEALDLSFSLGGLTIAKSSPKKPTPAASKLSNKMSFNVKKSDFVCWIPMEPFQIAIYTQFLISQRDRINEAIATSGQALPAIRMLRQIANHPRLLRKDGTDSLTFPGFNLPAKLQGPGVVEQSGKLRFLLELLSKLKREGRRVLLFSQSVKMLDLVEAALEEKAAGIFRRVRMDGSINKLAERKALVDEYNTNPDIFMFLMTTQVGGVGITLTSADRVIIFDPAWNTAMDDQAADRVYRIGQTKNVVIYRLISSGTIEEKIYRKQVFKGALAKSLLGKEAAVHTYFTRGELRELFTFDPDDVKTSQTQALLASLHSHKRESYPELDMEVDYLRKMDTVVGISDHNLLYTEEGEEMRAHAETETLAQHAHQLISKTIVPKDVVQAEQVESARSAHSRGPVTTIQVSEARQRRVPAPAENRIGEIELLTADEVFDRGLNVMSVTQSKVRKTPFASEKPRRGNLGGNDRIATLPTVSTKSPTQTNPSSRPPTNSTTSSATNTKSTATATATTLTTNKFPVQLPVVIKKSSSVIPTPAPIKSTKPHIDLVRIEDEDDDLAALVGDLKISTHKSDYSGPSSTSYSQANAPSSSLSQPPASVNKIKSRRVIEEDDDDVLKPLPFLSKPAVSAPAAILMSAQNASKPHESPKREEEKVEEKLASETHIKPAEASSGQSPALSVDSPVASAALSVDSPVAPAALTDISTASYAAPALVTLAKVASPQRTSQKRSHHPSEESASLVVDTEVAKTELAKHKMSRKSIISFEVSPTEDTAEAFAVNAGLDDDIQSPLVDKIEDDNGEEDGDDSEEEESQDNEQEVEENDESDDDSNDACSEASESELTIISQEGNTASKHYLPWTRELTDEEEADATSIDENEDDSSEDSVNQSTHSSFIAPEDEDIVSEEDETVDYDERDQILSRLLAHVAESKDSKATPPSLASVATSVEFESTPAPAAALFEAHSTHITNIKKPLSWTQPRSKRVIFEDDE